MPCLFFTSSIVLLFIALQWYSEGIFRIFSLHLLCHGVMPLRAGEMSPAGHAWNGGIWQDSKRTEKVSVTRKIDWNEQNMFSFSWYPFDSVLRCDFSTVWTVVKTVLKTNGPLGFYQGLTSTIMREIPGYFCFFGAYELCRSKFAQHMDTDKDSIGMVILFSIHI